MTTFQIGDKVKNLSDRVGKIINITEPTATIDYNRGHPETTSLKYLTLLKAAPVPRYLRETTLTESLSTFIDYLRTPKSNCLLYLEARNPDFEQPIRDKYKSITGEDLIDNFGFNVAPFTANKQGSEGSVRFNPPTEYPEDIRKMLSPDGTGHINHLGFVWLLVREGFRVSR